MLLSLTLLIKQCLFTILNRDFRVILFLTLIGLYSVQDITIIEIMALVILGKCNLVSDNIYRFLIRIVQYISEPDYEVVNISYSEERGMVVDRGIIISSISFQNEFFEDPEESFMNNLIDIIHRGLKKILVVQEFELFPRHVGIQDLIEIVDSREKRSSVRAQNQVVVRKRQSVQIQKVLYEECPIKRTYENNGMGLFTRPKFLAAVRGQLQSDFRDAWNGSRPMNTKHIVLMKNDPIY